MINAVRATDRFSHQAVIFNGSFDVFQVLVVDDGGQIFSLPRRKIIDDQDLVPPGQQRLGQVRADESGTAGD